MTSDVTSELLSKFNQIYENACDEKNFNVDDKPCFREVYDTIKRFNMPSMPFQMNLRTLKMKKADSIECDIEGLYLSRQNKLIYKDPECMNHELFHVASASGKDTTGIVLQKRDGVCLGTSLNEGITDMFASYSNPNCPVIYPFQKMCAESLMYVYGPSIFEPYFRNNPVGFVSQFDKMTMLEFMDNLDKYSASMTSVLTSLKEEVLPNPNDVLKASMKFSKVLEILAALYHKSGITRDSIEFKTFICESLCNPEMTMVMNIVTRFGLNESEDYQRLF